MGWLFHSIKGKIVLMIVLIIGIGFSGFEAYDYITTKKNAISELNELADIKADRLAENLALPLWEVDENWASGVVEAEMADNHVYAVMVMVEGERFLSKQRDASWAIIDSNEAISGDFVVRDRAIMHDGSVFGELQIFISKKLMYDGLYQEIWREAVGLLLVALMMLLVLILSLNRFVLRRIQDLLAETEVIAAGDYSSARKHAYGNDEIGLLGDGIETMRRNIQERENALRESETRFRQLIESAPDGIFIADVEGRYTDVNSFGCKMLGYERDELIGKTIMDIIPPEDVHRLLESKDKMMEANGSTHLSEWTLIRKDGTSFPVEVSANILSSGEWRGFVRDISGRIQAEEKIRRYSQAVMQSGEAIVITDSDGVIEHINPAFTKITGYSEDESIGAKTSILKSGNQDASIYKHMWETISAGKTWRGKVINRKKSGEYYPAMLTVSPIIDESGEISRYVGIQQNLEEMEALEAQFRQSQKMEAIGTLVGGIAHDFNNTLAGITGNLYMAKKEAESIPKVVSRLDSVERLAFGAAATIQQLLTFSRKGMVQMAPVDLAPLLKETIKLQKASIPENISLNIEEIEPGLIVKCDVNQFQQVLINLINNAVDALERTKEPSVSISLRNFEVDAELANSHEDAHEGGYAHISVSDNGSGIEPEFVEHLFEPFFTTKSPDKGTGMGLAMVYGAVKTHGGFVSVESSMDSPSGTTMHLYLPLTERAAIDSQFKRDEGIEHGSETILLVDDNELVLQTGEDVLESLGYSVIKAVNGEEAIDIYKQRQSEIALLILDIVMPKLSGIETLRAIHKLNPSIKAMFATGYDRDSAIKESEFAKSVRVIGKPFRVEEISRAVRELLDEDKPE